MLRRPLFALTLGLATAGCVLDSTLDQTTGGETTTTGAGGAVSSAGGGSTTDTTTTTSSMMTSASGGGSVGGGGTGGAPPDLCRNGELDPGEQCEDGNDIAGDDVPNDTCTACKLEAKACGDGELSPGEDCDGGPNCTNCVLDASSCVGATSLPDGDLTGTLIGLAAKQFGNLATDFNSACDPANDMGVSTQVWRFETGDFPEGIAVSLDHSAYTRSTLFAYRGCGSTPLICDVNNYTNHNDFATEILPPHTALYVGYMDRDAATFTFTGSTYRYRYRATFDSSAEGYTGTGWSYSGGLGAMHGNVNSTPNEALASGPAFYVGGLGPKAHVYVRYSATGNNVKPAIHASFDGGTDVAIALAPSGSTTTVELDFDRPPNTEKMSLSLGVSSSSSNYCDFYVSTLVVGAPPPP